MNTGTGDDNSATGKCDPVVEDCGTAGGDRVPMRNHFCVVDPTMIGRMTAGVDWSNTNLCNFVQKT